MQASVRTCAGRPAVHGRTHAQPLLIAGKPEAKTEPTGQAPIQRLLSETIAVPTEANHAGFSSSFWRIRGQDGRK